jgi:serine/threonine protein kinase
MDLATMRAIMPTGSPTGIVLGAPPYMAPEILSKQDKYDREKVVVWSMGVILYEMVCGALPWIGKDVPSLLDNMHTKPLAIPPALGLSKELCDLLVHALEPDAELRMRWMDVLGHVWPREPQEA